MDNLGTVLTVALICAALGFVAGSMLTTVWIDRNSKPARTKRKTADRNSKEFARIFLNPDAKSVNLEIEGEVYTPHQPPPAAVLEKLKSANSLLESWYHKDKTVPSVEES